MKRKMCVPWLFAVCILIFVFAVPCDLGAKTSFDKSTSKEESMQAPGAAISQGYEVQPLAKGPNPPVSPPHIQLPWDSSVFVCAGDPVCLEIFAFDPDPQDSITIEKIFGPGTYTPVTDTTPVSDTHCFYPSTSGSYKFIFKVTDKGGLSDTDTATITVDVNEPPEISVPDTVIFDLCDAEIVCFRIDIFDPEDGFTVHVTPLGYYTTCLPPGPSICFFADRDTTYNFVIIATDNCGASDTAYTTAIVIMNDPPVVTAPDTVKYNLSDTATVCFDLTISDPDDFTHQVWCTPPGGYNGSDTSICFFADHDTTYNFTIIVADSCGEADTAYTTAVVDFISNRPPVLTVPADVDTFLCEAETLCFVVGATDADPGDSIILEMIDGPGVFAADTGLSPLLDSICFLPDDVDSTYRLIFRATDEGGVTDEDTFYVTVDLNELPTVVVPADTSVFLCEPETLRFVVQASDPDPGDTIILEMIDGPGVFAADTGLSPLLDSICFLPDDVDSTYRLIFRVTNHCGAIDEDTFYVTVDLNGPPAVLVLADTSVILREGKTLCFDIEISDPDDSANVSLNSPWYYDSEDTSICVFASIETTYCCTVIVTDSCELADTAIMCVTVDLNEPPTVEVISPPSGGVFSYLPMLSIDLDDDLGLDRAYYQIDSCTGTWTEFWSYNSSSSDTSIDWTVPSISQGLHTIYFKVTDDSGAVNVDTCSYSWSFTYLVPMVSIVPCSLSAQCRSDYILWIHLDENVVDLDSAFFKIAYEDSFITATNVLKGPALTPTPNFDISRVIYSDSILISLAVISGTFDGPGQILGVVLTPGSKQVLTQMSIAYSALYDSAGQEIIHQTKGAEIKISCSVSVDEELAITPSAYALSQNYPNPYNLETRIAYQLPQPEKVLLRIYNIRGQLVRTLVSQNEPAGNHVVIWDSTNDDGIEVSTGIYLYRIEAGQFTDTKKMLLLK